MITNSTILNVYDAHPGRIMLLSEIEWPTQVIYTHNRAGEKFWDNKIWIGVGHYASIGPISAGNKTGQLQLSLQVPDNTLVNEAVKDDAVGRYVKLYVAATDENRRIIATQLISFKFIADVGIEYDLINTISLNCGSHRERAAGAKRYNRLTANAWRSRHPNDSYCDDIETISKGPLSSYTGSQRAGGGPRTRAFRER